MRPVSAGFLRTVRGSHVMRSRAKVCAPGQTGTQPAGTEIPILGGDVQTEAAILGGTRVTGATVRASLDMVTEGSLWPYKATDLLAPFGNEIYAERGIAFGNGVVEWVGLGYFRIYTPDQDKAPDGPIGIVARDRMSGLADARMLQPRQFTAATTVGTVVSNLVTEVYPAAVIEWDDATSATLLGRSMIVEEDRFAFLADLIAAYGKTWAWDYRGHLVIASPPDVAEPEYAIDAGVDGVLVSMARDISREGTYNGVVATGEGADTNDPVRGVAVDNDPSSPTYWNGPFGKVPRYYSSPFITTTQQAKDAASAILLQSLGVPYNVSFGTVPNPALEALDPVVVAYPRTSRSGSMRLETHVLEHITVPLVADGVMTARTKQQQLATIGVS